MTRNVLGKGLAAIISNEPAAEKRLIELDVALIHPNPFQPRKKFVQSSIQELADSMRESGLLQPIVVFKKDDKFFLIVGERRWRAAQLLKWEKIQAIVREISEREFMVDSLVENIQRENLNPLEVAEGVDQLLKKSGLNQQDAADKLGMNRTTLTNFLRLLKLPQLVKNYLSEGEMDQGHARALLSLEREADILQLAHQIIKKRFSVRQTENLVKNFSKKGSIRQRSIDPDITKIESKLTKLLAAKVTLFYSKSGKGKIQIHFPTLNEFERIYAWMTKEQT